MSGWTLDDLGVCAALMAASGVLLALRLPPRAARVVWLGLLSAGLLNALAINLRDASLHNVNYVHYYMGSKYSFPYRDFYKLVQAALERPQLGIRDLDHPARMLRSDTPEQRAYYIDLLRSEGAQFDPLAPLDQLARRAIDSRAIARESERILRDGLPENRIDEFRRDVRTAALGYSGPVLTADFGFNGSPLYALLRHVDPTLYRPYGRSTAYVHMGWQIVATLLICWIVGLALDLELHSRIAIGALVFASQDFAYVAFPGLVFGECWIPVALAALAMRHRRAAAAGAAIAWATLIKLFPLILLLPALARIGSRFLGFDRAVGSSKRAAWCLRVVAACMLAIAAFGLVSLLSGRSWVDFVHKIVVQFHAPTFAANSVSASAALRLLGVPDALMPRALSAFALVVLTAMFLRGDDDKFMAALPRRCLVLVAALGWVLDGWLDYYALVPCFLLPYYAREHRAGAATAAISMAVPFLLPDFIDPILESHPLLGLLKIAPYLMVPAWMVALELRGTALQRTTRRVALAAVSILLVATATDAWRGRTIQRYERSARQRAEASDFQGALRQYRGILRLDPWNVPAHMDAAIASASLGDTEAAAAGFARAVALEPDSPVAQYNYARMLFQADHVDAAQTHLEAARALAPHDFQVLFLLARVRLAQGRTGEAATLLTRARELEPGDRRIAELLERVEGS